MPGTIETGEKGRASDFIFKSEANATPANDEGRVPKLESDGFLHKYFRRRKTSTQTSHANPTINTDLVDRHTLTAQVVDIASMTTNLSGTPVDGEPLDIRFTIPASSFTLRAISAPGNSTTAAFVVNKPTGTLEGDIMIAMVHDFSDTVATAAPAGWTALDAWATLTNGVHVRVWWKVAGASEGSSYTWTTGNTNPFRATIGSYYGNFNKANPISVFSSVVYNTNNTVLQAGSIKVPHANSPLLFLGFAASNGDTVTKPATPNTSWQEDMDSYSNATHNMNSMLWTGSGETGTISATLSGSNQYKHAYAVALNPGISVAWGSKYVGSDSTLLTYLEAGKDYEFPFKYNSTLAKFQLYDPISWMQKRMAAGNFTKDLTTTTTTTIAHGLSKAPRMVEITGSHSLASGGAGRAETVILDTSTQYSHWMYADTASGTQEGSGAEFRFAQDGVGSAYLQGAVTVDDTNITITWTKVGSPAADTAYCNWKAWL